jgi:mRNA interferase RelE/StbE
MRVGKVRVIFTINTELDELQVYDIDFRGNIYKALSLYPSANRAAIDLRQNDEQ